MSMVVLRNTLLRVLFLIAMLFGIYKFVTWFVAV
jgi:hypothetical protein